MAKQKKSSSKLKVVAKRVSPVEMDLHIAGGRFRYQTGGGGGGGAVWTTAELLDTPSDWDDWYEQAYRLVPEAGSAVEQVVALVSGCSWVANRGDDASLQMLQEFVSRPNIMLGGAMFQAIWNYYTYGRCIIQAHQAKQNDPSSIDTIKVPDPRTFRICRDNEQDYGALTSAAQTSGTSLGAIKDPIAHTGKIIGYIQQWMPGPYDPQGSQVQTAPKPLIFKTDDLLFIPRATPKFANGVGILYNEYKKCVNLAGAEEMLARATRIYSNPPWYITVGSADYPCPPNASGQAMLDFVKTQIGALSEAGNIENITQIVLPNWAQFVLPRFDIPIAPVVVEHLYKQLNWLLTGIGIPPAVMSAEGFRATAHEALRVMEDRIHPIRERFQSEITARILLPYMTAMHGNQPPGTSWFMPEWSWRDITPGDLDRVRETLTIAHGAPFLSKNEARSIHGGLAPDPVDVPAGGGSAGKPTLGTQLDQHLQQLQSQVKGPQQQQQKNVKQAPQQPVGP